MTRGQRKGELIAIVADLLAMRYRPADIARTVGRTPERIRQIAATLSLSPPRLSSIADLPLDLQSRVTAFRAQDTSESQAIPEQ